MEFKPDKCELLRITRKRNKLIFPCTLHNKELGTIDATKYLGATYTISKGLSWSSHIYNITQKQTTHYIKRNIKISNKQVKEKAYNTCVRSNLEYCSTI